MRRIIIVALTGIVLAAGSPCALLSIAVAAEASPAADNPSVSVGRVFH